MNTPARLSKNHITFFEEKKMSAKGKLGNVCALNGILIVVFMAAVCASAFGEITLLDNRYKVETVAVYNQGLYKGRVKYIAADAEGRVYLTHDDSEMLVAENGVVSVLSTGFKNLQGVTWGGGTSFGNYAYAAEVNTRKIRKIDNQTNASTLVTLPQQPLLVAIDRTGNYGNQMYAATRNSTKIYSISNGGTFSEFVDLSALTGGWPFDMAFDTTGRFGGKLYISLSEVTNQNYWGILSVDTDGTVSPIGIGGYWGNTLDFDSTPDQSFGGDFYVAGGTGIYRVAPDQSYTQFLQVDGPLKDFTFGPDGSMYIVEVDSWSTLTGPVTISKVTLIPEPATLFLLGVGGFSLLKARKRG